MMNKEDIRLLKLLFLISLFFMNIVLVIYYFFNDTGILILLPIYSISSLIFGTLYYLYRGDE